ncbi:MAG TPA: hypothetical protein ENK06_09830, partial [Gammaproteobacteria bacterium]|nr:hypothetical protein [Gammaproteobacteria bacterium]
MYPSSIFQICCKSFAYIVVTLLVVVALALSLARLLVPSIESYKSDVEVWVSEQIGQQVEIATLDAGWYGVEPQLILKGVRLLSDDRMQIHGYFQQARLGIDLYSSALEGRLLPGAFTLEGARFVLVRQTDGNVSIEGLANSTETENSENKHLLDEWLFKQRFLEVKNSEIVWIDLRKDGKPSVFSDVNLRLRNDGASHRVDGWVNLPDSLGARLEVAIDVQGSLLSGNTWSGEVYVETEKLNVAELSQYFPEESLNIGGGKVNFRLWSHWDNAKLVSVRGNASLNDVQVSAKHVARMRVINQLTTNFLAVNTHRDWEITLDKVQVKSGRRLWPQTRIDIKYNPQSGRLDTELAYLDLKEVLPLMRFVMPRNSELSKTILGLNATGIVSDLFMQFHPGGKQDEYFATGRLSGLTTHPWRDIPGVQNL